VLVKDGAKYIKVEAGDLAIGAKARTLNVSEETIAAVTVQPVLHGVISLGLAHQNAFVFAVDPQSDMAIPVVPEIQWPTPVDCWGPLEEHAHQVVP